MGLYGVWAMGYGSETTAYAIGQDGAAFFGNAAFRGNSRDIVPVYRKSVAAQPAMVQTAYAVLPRVTFPPNLPLSLAATAFFQRLRGRFAMTDPKMGEVGSAIYRPKWLDPRISIGTIIAVLLGIASAAHFTGQLIVSQTQLRDEVQSHTQAMVDIKDSVADLRTLRLADTAEGARYRESVSQEIKEIQARLNDLEYRLHIRK